MSDPNLILQRQLLTLETGHERLRKADVSGGSGTAFPAGATTGMTFFRTDLGFLCYYDGTRWLSVHTIDIRFPRTAYSAATTDVSVMAVLPSDYAISITRFELYASTGVTNDASNYWFYQLQRSSADISAGVTTALGGASTDYQIGANAALVVTIGGYLNIRVAKNGAPSNISAAGLARYRLIVP